MEKGLGYKWSKFNLWHILSIALVACLIGACNWLKINCSFSKAQIANTAKSGGSSGALLGAFFAKESLLYILGCVKSIFVHRFVANVGRSGTIFYFKRFLNVRYAAFTGISVGAIQHNITLRAQALTELVSTVLIGLVSDVCFLFFVLCLLRHELPWRSMAKIAACVAAMLAVSSWGQRRRARLRHKVNDAHRQNMAMTLEILMNYECLHAFGNVESSLAAYAELLASQQRHKSVYELMCELLCMLNQGFLLLLLGFVFYEYNRLNAGVENIMPFTILLTELRGVIYNIHKDLNKVFVSSYNLSETIVKSADREVRKSGIRHEHFQSAIQLDRMSLRLGRTEVLGGIDCAIGRGEKIAVTGACGAGKSIFLKCLGGLYEYGGSIRYDGVELRDLDRASLRAMVAYIPQCAYLFDKSLIENLADGRLGVSDAEIVRLARECGFDEAFSEIGYDADVGERGSNLSGGQKQKACFFRALLSQRPVLLMDRAFASMDAKSGLNFSHFICSRLGDRTVVNIVDDLDGLESYDRILHFENRRIAESGALEELLQKKGRFYEYYSSAANN
ncbi:ATP-binding cassette, subfamily B, heavy metal transporter [Pancytospora philotis]|nr:ATP-binding cassette, subfamily B, heavy metal transporter [Pancytospora philotis]